MTRAAFVSSSAHKALSLAEALDFPRLDLVRLSTENPLLRRLAVTQDLEEDIWRDVTSWMETDTSAVERLRELRCEYYRLFLRTEPGLSIYLHDWYPEVPAHQFLSDWRQFLDSIQLVKTTGWRNGADHVSLCLETLAHLALCDHSELSRFKRVYLEAWFSVFAARLGSEARSPFYLAAAKLAGGLGRDLEALA